MGRVAATRRVPRRLTPALTRKLVVELRKGHTIKAACGYVGLHHSTFYDWCNRGGEAMERERDLKAGETLSAPELACLSFLEQVDVAVSHAEWQTFETFLGEARKKRGEGNWLPWMQILERRWRDDWGRPTRSTVELTGAEGGPIEVANVEGAAESLRAKLAPVIELRAAADAAAGGR